MNCRVIVMAAGKKRKAAPKKTPAAKDKEEGKEKEKVVAPKKQKSAPATQNKVPAGNDAEVPTGNRKAVAEKTLAAGKNQEEVAAKKNKSAPAKPNKVPAEVPAEDDAEVPAVVPAQVEAEVQKDLAGLADSDVPADIPGLAEEKEQDPDQDAGQVALEENSQQMAIDKAFWNNVQRRREEHVREIAGLSRDEQVKSAMPGVTVGTIINCPLWLLKRSPMAVGQGGFRQRSLSDRPNPGLLRSVNELGFAAGSTMTVVEIPWDRDEILQMIAFKVLPEDFKPPRLLVQKYLENQGKIKAGSEVWKYEDKEWRWEDRRFALIDGFNRCTVLDFKLKEDPDFLKDVCLNVHLMHLNIEDGLAVQFSTMKLNFQAQTVVCDNMGDRLQQYQTIVQFVFDLMGLPNPWRPVDENPYAEALKKSRTNNSKTKKEV